MAEEKNDKNPESHEKHEGHEESSSLDDKKYQNSELKGLPQSAAPQDDKEMKKVREKLESLKKFIITKYKFIKAIGIIHPQAAEMFDEENELSPEERKEKPMHLIVIMPDDKEKEYNKVKEDIVKKIKENKQKIWLNLFLERDIWDICMDSKYAMIEAIGLALPLYDKGILGALRVAQIHKSLVLKKFEKYVYSYVIGGSLVRGEAIKTSDVDTYVIIDDTDVKRMPRVELREKLRNIIWSYIMQAGELAGVKNQLNVQIYLLTEFWDGVKEANPVFFTFIRDGVPFYDRGGFLPWKLLLRMGKIKPSPESIDMYMSLGDKTNDIIKRKLLDIVMGDIFLSVSYPSQALLMLYGLPPTNVKETVAEMRRVFVEKEKLIEKKYVDILEEIMITYYKGYEHEKIKEVTGKDVDRLMKNADDYLKRLKELRKDLEKEMQKKSFDEAYENVFKMMRSLFGDKSENALIDLYEKEVVGTGKANPKFIHTLNELISTKKKYATKKEPTKYAFETLRKDCVYLTESLIEYGQRRDLGLLQKTKLIIVANNKANELFLTEPAFLACEGKVKKFDKEKFVDSTVDEMDKVLTNYKGNRVKIDNNILEALKKEFGNFEVSL
jgi:predicted nucleotidyltransferase/uncharacterized protein (UPF0332 family)